MSTIDFRPRPDCDVSLNRNDRPNAVIESSRGDWLDKAPLRPLGSLQSESTAAPSPR
ncbi:hypothetical protein NXT3_PA00320 (plasmid) [Sinorhizobium fredii]|uniref:Uncharacterized protein n=1 Tax=Rhizobium fredii TaxID=380 RepID=A0A2L0HAT3_RHIFR|nr:hypothetical protein NXT3_PA00320 [Sinorhizobium fredii]